MWIRTKDFAYSISEWVFLQQKQQQQTTTTAINLNADPTLTANSGKDSATIKKDTLPFLCQWVDLLKFLVRPEKCFDCTLL